MPDRLASKSCTSPDSITSSASGSFRAQAILTHRRGAQAPGKGAASPVWEGSGEGGSSVGALARHPSQQR